MCYTREKNNTFLINWLLIYRIIRRSWNYVFLITIIATTVTVAPTTSTSTATEIVATTAATCSQNIYISKLNFRFGFRTKAVSSNCRYLRFCWFYQPPTFTPNRLISCYAKKKWQKKFLLSKQEVWFYTSKFAYSMSYSKFIIHWEITHP